jgi:acetylornithine deacetylase
MFHDELKKKVIRKIEEDRENVIEFARKLVQSPTTFGLEKDAQEIVAKKLRESGVTVDVWEPRIEELQKSPGFIKTSGDYRNRPNVVGRITGDGKGRSLILNGHIDVVSAEPTSAWKFDPWGGLVQNGRLYGRGSCDMKGGLAAMISAASAISELELSLRGDVLVESVIEEEIGGPGGTLATIIRGYRADAAIVGEPPKSICIESAGVCWFRVRVIGKTQHAGFSHLGVNAIGKAMKIYQGLLDLDSYRAESKHYPLTEKHWGRSCNINIGTIRGGDWPSTVAGWAELECRIGWQPIETMTQVKSEVEETIRKVAELDPWMRDHPPVVEWFGWSAEASETDSNSPIIQVLRKNARDIMGVAPEIIGSTAADDTRWFVLCANIPAVSFGPDGDNIHGIDEYVLVDDLVATAKIYALTILDWCG